MRSPLIRPLVLMCALALACSLAAAGMVSRQFEFREDVTLEIGVATDDGLRLDSVHFALPRSAGSAHPRTAGLSAVQIALSNTSEQSHMVGVALAVFDAEGRLVGVASGGSKLLPLKPERQKTYTLVFNHVNGGMHRAKTFRITLESR